MRPPHRCPRCGELGRRPRGPQPGTAEAISTGRLDARLAHRSRRYSCPACGERWSTYELAATDYDRLRASAARGARRRR